MGSICNHLLSWDEPGRRSHGQIPVSSVVQPGATRGSPRPHRLGLRSAGCSSFFSVWDLDLGEKRCFSTSSPLTLPTRGSRGAEQLPQQLFHAASGSFVPLCGKCLLLSEQFCLSYPFAGPQREVQDLR